MLYNIKNLSKKRSREQEYQLLIRNLQINQGDRLAITGPSGCGKSTTLDILGLSLRPDSAEAFTFSPNGSEVAVLSLWEDGSGDKLAGMRLAHMGYVLQSGELLPFLSAGENMMLTARLAGMSLADARKNALELAERLSIAHLWNAMPQTLSVGERQRAAIARALASRPQVILADEPTAALDPLHADKVMDAFLDALEKFASTLVLVTHNAQWAASGKLEIVSFVMEESSNGSVAILDNARKLS